MDTTLRHKMAMQALARLTGSFNLSITEQEFVMEYSKDHNHRRAARSVGVNPDNGMVMLNNPAVLEAIRYVWLNTMLPSQLTSEVVKEEMFNLYQISLTEGNLSQAGKQLDQLAKHSHIDAYAAQKVSVAADAQIAEALQQGRQRVKQASVNNELSFL